MNRDEPIVYLGTENSLKSVLGLKEIVEDGWSVRLVIAYVAPPGRSERLFLTRTLRSGARTIKNACARLYRMSCGATGKIAPVSAGTLKAICQMHDIQYVATCDKSLYQHRLEIAHSKPAIILSNGWQYHISKDIGSMARLMALNCHSSFLPEYRGGNVTYAPLINEESQSGVTVHELVDRFDAGAILAQERVRIERGETPASLQTRRARVTGRVLIRALEVVGHPELYKENPPSPFYFRCSRAAFNRYRRVNFLRKLLGLPIRKYAPQERYDI